MDAGGPGCEGDVESVIQHEWHGERRDHAPRDRQQLSVRNLLEPQLHRGDTTRDRGLRHDKWVTSRKQRVVSDEQEAEDGG